MNGPLKACSAVWFSMTIRKTCRGEAAGDVVQDAATIASSASHTRTLIEFEVTGRRVDKIKGTATVRSQIAALRGIAPRCESRSCLMGERIPIPGTEIELPLGL